MPRDVVTVIGAGHGGKALAAVLAAQGWPVHLYNRTSSHLDEICRQGGITLEREDDSRVFTPLRRVTSNLGEALAEAGIVLVVVPATAHRDLARASAPYLRAGQVVLLNPGRTGGALEFAHVARDYGASPDCVVAEASTFLFASRSSGPATVRIFGTKRAVSVAAFPATHTPEAWAALTVLIPQLGPAETVLQTSLDNMGAMFHPALTLLNAGRIEATGGSFQFYVEGLTPAIARVIETLDEERIRVAAALGVRTTSATEWIRATYQSAGASLGEAIQNNPSYQGIAAPASLDHRYLVEDVPMSLVPIAELGRAYGVATPTMDLLIALAATIHRINYRSEGRTLERLGIAGLTLDELHRYVQVGDRAARSTGRKLRPSPSAAGMGRGGEWEGPATTGERLAVAQDRFWSGHPR